MDDQAGQPFACRYTESFPQLLHELGCSLAVSTYHNSRVILLSAMGAESIVQLPREFPRSMAMCHDRGRLAIACRNTVELLACSSGLAADYPNQPHTYDSLYVPRATYYTGHLDLHGLCWGSDGLWAVNTAFSCLALVEERFSFIPKWRPRFISGLEAEDRCHLNGVAMDAGIPVYATAMGSGDGVQSWRQTLPAGGVLIRVPDNEIVATGLPMPHSPRIREGRLWMLLSATGEVTTVDPMSGRHQVVARLDGFARGLAACGKYLFVGLSRLRKSSFPDLPIKGRANEAGIAVIDTETGSVAAELRYETTVEEIFDVVVLEGRRRPGIVNSSSDAAPRSLVTPSGTYWERADAGTEER